MAPAASTRPRAAIVPAQGEVGGRSVPAQQPGRNGAERALDKRALHSAIEWSGWLAWFAGQARWTLSSHSHWAARRCS